LERSDERMNEIIELKKITIVPNKEEIRDFTCKVENEMRKLPGALIGDSPEYLAVCPLTHTFVDGLYVRQIFMPKGMLFVTKIHKKNHPYFVLQGDVSVLTEEGIKHIKAPYSGVTKIGTKRIIYTHADTIWITVHKTDETDLEKIENEVIAKSFDEIDNVIDIKIIDFIEHGIIGVVKGVINFVEKEGSNIKHFFSSINPF
jgi:hypothetical protein